MQKHRFIDFIRKHRLFFVSILLQVIILLGSLLVAMIFPQQTMEILPSEFGTEQYPHNVIATDDLIQFRVDEGLAEPIKVKTQERAITSGCYDIEIEYISYIDDTASIENSAVTMNINPTKFVKAQSIVLDDAYPTAKGRIWVPTGLGLEDFQLEAIYNGSGTVTIYSIDIQEQMIYRYVKIAGLALLMGLLDYLYYVFFAKGARKKSYTKEVLILGGITLIGSLLFFNDYLILGHDLDFHLTRIAAVAEEFSNGQFPVRMMTSMCNGYGYANSLFYCDIFLWLPALLYNLMVPLQDCYKIYVVLVNLFTVVISYCCFREITENRKSGYLGAALYTLSTYRLTNLCLRGAVGEYTAMTFLPLIVLGMYKIYTSKKLTWKEWMPLALGMAGVMMSHILTVIMLAIGLLIFCVACITKTLNRDRILAIVKAAVITLLLTAWFIVPFVEGYLGMNLQVSNEPIEYIQRRGTYLSQLFGVFAPAFGGNVNNGMRNEMPLTIGFSLTIGLAGVLYYFWKRQEWNLEEDREYKTVKAFTLLSVLMLAFTLHAFPWNMLQSVFGETIAAFLGMVQYPWRYLALAAALIIPAVLLVLNEIQKRDEKIYRLLFGGISVALICSVGFFYFQLSHSATESRYYDMTNNRMMGVMVGEYFLDEIEEEVIDTYLINSVKTNLVSGNAIVEEYSHAEDGTVYFRCQNKGDGEAVIEIPVIAYDHYRALDSESNMELTLKKSDKGLVKVTLPNGYQGVVRVLYDPPYYWHIAEIVSAGTLLGLIYVMRKNRQKEVTDDRKIKVKN